MAILLVPATARVENKPEVQAPQPSLLVWPPPPAPARIQWVGELKSEFDAGAKKRRSFIDKLSGKSENALWFNRPLSVDVDERGVLYVGDFAQGVIGVDRERRRMWLFSQVSGRTLSDPVGIAVDSKMVFVCDAMSNTLSVFDKEGNFLSGLGPLDGLSRPVGVAVDEARDLLVVVNAGEHSVLLYNRSLKLLKKIGGRGTQDAYFNFPTYACMIPDTGFAVTDTGNFRVQIFDFNGRFVRSIGQVGSITGHFARPKGLAVDPDRNLYVVDATFANFQVFRTDGQLLTFVGQGGAGPGLFQVPSDITISKDGLIYVSDQLNRRIAILQYLQSAGGESNGKNEASLQRFQNDNQVLISKE